MGIEKGIAKGTEKEKDHFGCKEILENNDPLKYECCLELKKAGFCNIQTGIWSYEEAVDFLSKEADMPKATARRELNWYTQRPTYPLSYRLGKHLLLELKETIKAKHPKTFSDKWFHDSLLVCGKITYSVAKDIIDLSDPPK